MDQEIRYKVLTVDLGTLHAKREYKIPGYNLNVLSLDGSAKLRLNHNTADEIDLTLIDQIQSKFGRFYITNSAQSGKTLILAIGQHNFKIINDPMPVWQQQPDATLTEPVAVSGTMYTVLDTVKNARIISAEVDIEWTVQPNVEIYFIVNGIPHVHAIALPVSTSPYIPFRRPDVDAIAQPLILRSEANDLTAPSFLYEGKSIKVQAGRTGGTATVLNARVKWAKKVKR